MVEWKKLGEVCEIKTGRGITQKDCSEDGQYPVISGGQTPMGMYHNSRSDKANIKREIRKKEAELKTLSSMHHFVDGSSMGNTMIRKQVLQNEIEQLKNML